MITQAFIKDSIECRFSEATPWWDFRVVVEDRTFYLHKAIICLNSKYFTALGTSKMQEVQTQTLTLPECTSDTFEMLMMLMYGGQTDLQDISCYEYMNPSAKVPAHFMHRENCSDTREYIILHSILMFQEDEYRSSFFDHFLAKLLPRVRDVIILSDRLQVNQEIDQVVRNIYKTFAFLPEHVHLAPEGLEEDIKLEIIRDARQTFSEGRISIKLLAAFCPPPPDCPLNNDTTSYLKAISDMCLEPPANMSKIMNFVDCVRNNGIMSAFEIEEDEFEDEPVADIR